MTKVPGVIPECPVGVIYQDKINMINRCDGQFKLSILLNSRFNRIPRFDKVLRFDNIPRFDKIPRFDMIPHLIRFLYLIRLEPLMLVPFLLC